MIDINNLEEIRKIDPRDTYGSTDLAIEQAKAAWEEVKALPIEPLTEKITSVVFCGMGASVYGALVLKALVGEKLSFPIEIVSDYHIPSYVNNQTLIVLTSYSGTTEEVLSCAEEAKKKEAHMLVLTKGGPLATFAKENNLPAYIFDGRLNPAGVPRLGNGYSIIGLLGLFKKLGIIDLSDSDMEEAFAYVEDQKEAIKKQAMNDSATLENKIPIIFAAEHLSGNAQILRNQFNETSKAFSGFFLVPDLNHHLMEGLQFPKDAPLYFIILNSQNYSAKIKRRMELTVEVVKQNNRDIMEYMTHGETVYQDMLEAITYGSWLTLYLGLRYDQNPAINPYVDYFKEQLAK